MKTFPIIAKLGGRDAAHARLKERGFKKSVDAIRMWETRGSIPGDAIVLLMRIAEAEGVECSADDLCLSSGFLPRRQGSVNVAAE